MSQYHSRTPSGHPDQRRPEGPPGPPGTNVPVNFETHEIPPSERLQIPEVRVKRAGSADPREYGPQDHQIQHQGPVHGQGQPPAAFQNDAFFNERITIPRPVAMNEQEHFATEEFDNKDRGDLDEEEHSYDKQVRHSHFRSGSLPAKRFGERSLFADRSLYDERGEAAQRGGGYHYRWNYHHGPERREALPQYDHRELANEPWRDYEQRREAANAERFRSEQAYREEQQRREEEERRRFGASHQRSHAYRSSSVGPVGGAGERYGYEEHYSGGLGSNYVRPEYTSTLRRDARQQQQLQQQQRSSHHQSRQAGGGSSGWAYSSWGNRGGPYKEQRYRKIRCCCFSFYWPPWGYEEAEPPRPLYPSNSKVVGPPPPAHLGPPPPLEEYPPGPQKRPY